MITIVVVAALQMLSTPLAPRLGSPPSVAELNEARALPGGVFPDSWRYVPEAHRPLIRCLSKTRLPATGEISGWRIDNRCSFPLRIDLNIGQTSIHGCVAQRLRPTIQPGKSMRIETHANEQLCVTMVSGLGVDRPKSVVAGGHYYACEAADSTLRLYYLSDISEPLRPADQASLAAMAEKFKRHTAALTGKPMSAQCWGRPTYDAISTERRQKRDKMAYDRGVRVTEAVWRPTF